MTGRRPPAGLRRGLSALLLLGAAGVGLVGSGMHPAAAAGPDKVGWWSQVEQLPVPVPIPGVPSGGFMVQQGPSGPTAYAAVHYTVPPGASGTLQLSLAGAPVGTASILACPITGAWSATDGPGAWADRPHYTGPCSPGILATDNSLAAFGLTADQTPRGVVDFAIVPLASASPFSITFNKPDANSLTITSVTVPPPPAPAAPPIAPAPKETVAPAETPAPSFDIPPPAVTPSIAPTATPQVAPSAPAPTAPPAVQLAAPASRVVRPGDDRGTRTVAVFVLFGLLLAWWFVGSAPGRAPRLIGAVAGAGAPAVPITGRVGGVGRFARQRSGSARRL